MTDKLQIEAIEREMIFEFITEFLDSDPDYDLLSQEEKDKTFGIYQTILSAIYKSSFYKANRTSINSTNRMLSSTLSISINIATI